jgi:hypothetical protein
MARGLRAAYRELRTVKVAGVVNGGVMVVEVRRTLVWATAVASVASAMLLTSTGGGMPRIAGDASHGRTTPSDAAAARPGAAGLPGHAAPRSSSSSAR